MGKVVIATFTKPIKPQDPGQACDIGRDGPSVVIVPRPGQVRDVVGSIPVALYRYSYRLDGADVSRRLRRIDL